MITSDPTRHINGTAGMDLMIRKTLSDISRSEMPKSVLLSFLLERAGFLAKLRQSATFQNKWLMRPISEGAPHVFDLSLDSVKIMTTANFHIRRDLGASESSFVEEHGLGTPKNEIDVVAVIENKIAIGFELKWNSRIGSINIQLSQERECLKLLARYYCCDYISNVAVLPIARVITEADAIITYADLHKVLVAMNDQTDLFMRLAEREFARMKPSEPWEFVTDVETLLARSDASLGGECVGYEKGLPHLKACSISELENRPSWKIARRLPDTSWFPLGEVAEVIREKLSQNSKC
jgi:hypothetical protein